VIDLAERLAVSSFGTVKVPGAKEGAAHVQRDVVRDLEEIVLERRREVDEKRRLIALFDEDTIEQKDVEVRRDHERLCEALDEGHGA